MSRNYQLEIRVRYIDEDTLKEVMLEEFGISDKETIIQLDKIIYFSGETTLGGGISELGMHRNIEKALKRKNKHARVLTKWTYLDDLFYVHSVHLPYEEYGSTDVDPLEEAVIEGGERK